MRDLVIKGYSNDAVYEEDANGAIRVSARVMKTGLLKYTDPRGVNYTANISEQELENSISTAGLKPIIHLHGKDMIDPDNYRDQMSERGVGTSAENFRVEEKDGEQWLVGDFVIQNKDEIELVKKAKVENKKVWVSSGYYRDPVQTGASSFDFKNIKFNHYALNVGTPRAKGASLDSIDAIIGETQNNKNEVNMKYVLADEMPVEYDEKPSGAIDIFKSRENKLKDEVQLQHSIIAENKKSMDDAAGKIQGFELQIAELNKKLENTCSMDDLDTKVQELTDVKADATERGVDIKECKNVFEVKKKAVETVFDKSFDDALVEGAYSALPAIKDSKDIIKSKEKLTNAGKKSMDSVVSISRMSPNEIKHRIKYRIRRGA